MTVTTTQPRAPTQPVGAPATVATGVQRRRVSAPSLALGATGLVLVWIGVSTLHGTGGIGAGLAAGRSELLAPAVLLLVGAVLVCERRWPAEPRAATARGHVQDGLYFALHVAAVVPLMTLLSVAFAHLLGNHAAWLELPFTARWSNWVLVPITLVLMDGSNWLAHWADHRFTLLWRMHALHHSQEELSVLTSFRAHPLSHLPGFLLAALPVWVAMGGRGLAPVMVTAYVCLGTLPHANLAWSFGPLGRLVVSPAYHRLHHAVDGTDGANLGVVLTVWDVLAGRALFPEKAAAVPKTGLRGGSVPTEQSAAGGRLGLLAAQLAEPFLVLPERTATGRHLGPQRETRPRMERAQAWLGAPAVLNHSMSSSRGMGRANR